MYLLTGHPVVAVPLLTIMRFVFFSGDSLCHSPPIHLLGLCQSGVATSRSQRDAAGFSGLQQSGDSCPYRKMETTHSQGTSTNKLSDWLPSLLVHVTSLMIGGFPFVTLYYMIVCGGDVIFRIDQ